MVLLLISLFMTCEYKSRWLIAGIYGWGFATKDSLLFAASGYGADIFNISNPSAPVLVSSIMTPGLTFDVKVADNLVYICDDYAGVRIFDVSNPILPVEIGWIDTPGLASEICIKDTIAYVADDWTGVRIINIHDPSNPVELGFFDTPGRAIWIDVEDTLAYVSDYQNGLLILNVRDPSNPQFVGQWQDANLSFIWAVDVRDTLVYLTGQYLIPPQLRHFMVLNVSNPTAPSYVSGIRFPESPYGFMIKDTLAFIICGYNAGVRIVNIANPLNMYEVNFIPGFHHYDLAISDSLLFTTYATYATYGIIRDHCIKIYDISTPDSVVPIGQFVPQPYIYDVCAKGNNLFVLTGKEYINIVVFDCAVPESIIFIDSLIICPGSWGSLTYDSPYVYVSHSSAWSILEFSNNSLYHLTTVNRPAEAIVKKDSFLITGTSNSQFGLYSYDITSPSHPIPTDSLPLRCEEIVIVDSFVYIGYYNKLYVVNVANPHNLVLVCSLNTGHHPRTIEKFPPYLIIGNGDWCLQVVDISVPTNPQIINSIPTSSSNKDCVIKDSILIVGGSYKGVFLYDLSNPINPRLIDSCDTPGWAENIAVVDDYLYVADFSCLGLIKFTSSGISENRQAFSKRRYISVRPNPFVTNLLIELKSAPNEKNTRLRIYDIVGRMVKQFNHSTNHQSPILWSGDDNSGQKVSNGVYFIHLETDDGAILMRQKVIKLE